MRVKLSSNALLLGLCALLFVSAWPEGSSVAQSVRDSRQNSEQRPARIPFELNDNHIFLQGRVNDSEPLWFVLDTGSSNSVMNADRARELGLKTRGGFQATGAGGTVASGVASDITFKLGDVLIDDLNVGVVPLNSLEDVAGRRMDVVLGSDLFKHFVVEIDYESKHLNLYEPKNFVYKGAGEILPLTFSNNHPYVRARVALPGREAIEGEFIVDLGANAALTLLPSFIEKYRILKSVAKTIITSGRGVGGEVEMPVGRVNSLQLGRFRFDNPVTGFPQRGTFGREGKAGNIGAAMMRRFKVIFDYSRQRMMLEPNKNYAEPFEFDMSGLQLITDSPVFKSVKVRRVIENSPAAEAGIKPDDEIMTINGRPAAAYRLMQLREMLKHEGQTFEFEIKRGDQLLKLKFKTRRLI